MSLNWEKINILLLDWLCHYLNENQLTTGSICKGTLLGLCRKTETDRNRSKSNRVNLQGL